MLPNPPHPTGVSSPWLRHAWHFGPLALLTAAGAVLALPDDLARIGPLQGLYALAVALNVWPLAMASWGGVLGAGASLWQRCGGRVAGPLLRPPTGRARTAVLLPIHEEDAVRVFAAAAVMAEALASEGAGTLAFFVLSDTASAAGALREEQAFAALLATRPPGGPAIHYRRRTERIGRKAGNIADFCARWGADYDYMVVLDADSLMTGPAIARLVGAMEANPGAALIQGMCYPAGRDTLFARIQQFSAWLYGPLFQRGLAFWQGPRGSYWGHNAILRVDAFAAQCGLPVLPGRAPLGGEIMSHDTVEAALLLRAGWDVWLLPEGPGSPYADSWEEVPTNLLDHLKRERRWCQGNLQHCAVLGADGLRPASYYHLNNGILHYLAAPFFLFWLLLYAGLDRHAPGREAALAGLVLALVLVPRALCLLAVLASREQATRFGGRLALVASAALEQGFGLLLYPVTLVFHVLFIAGAVTGHAVRWDAQARGDRGVGAREAAARLLGPLGIGLLVAALLAARAPVLAVLLAPGLLLGVPLAVWSSRAAVLGPWRRLFAIPEEVRPHPTRLALAAAEARLRRSAGAAGALPPLPRENGAPLVTQALRRSRRRPEVADQASA